MDVTDHGALKQTDAMYEALVEQIPAVVYVDADNEESPALFVSTQIEQMLGYAREEWLEARSRKSDGPGTGGGDGGWCPRVSEHRDRRA